jgi:tRNA (cmo5U34)-methyltransferase
MKIPSNWTFKSAEVAEGFDRHVREQLPWYDLTTGIVAHVARHYIPEGGLVYDIGASTGNIGRALSDTLEKRNANLVAIDNAPEMSAIYQGPGEIVTADALEFDYERFDFAVAFLALMFFPVTKRRSWVHSMTAKIKPGGAMLIFDKCSPGKGYASTVLSRLALAGKRASGVPADEIVEKELSLAGVQRPIDWMAVIPPQSIEVFRFGDFAGWLIEGPSENP